MKRNNDSILRAACGVGAVAMTAITYAVFVVVPANLEPPGGDARVQARVPALEPAAIEVAITASPIEVVGVRAQKTTLERALALVPKPRQRG
jgi:hypothetical protein